MSFFSSAGEGTLLPLVDPGLCSCVEGGRNEGKFEPEAVGLDKMGERTGVASSGGPDNGGEPALPGVAPFAFVSIGADAIGGNTGG